MPGFNQTGPMGQGPMTGRRMGRCTNYGASMGRNIEPTDTPQPQEFAGRGMGRGSGMGRGPQGRGMGRGFGRGRGFGMQNRGWGGR